MKILPLLVGFGIAALLPATAPCAAPRCSCLAEPQVAEAAGRADAVFSGVALSVTDSTDVDGYPERRVAFRVDAAWKGAPGETVVISTGLGGGDCGYPFRAGREYLVFAEAEDGALFTGICSLTSPIEEAEAELALLGTPERTRHRSR